MSTPVQLTDVKFDTTIYPRSDLRQDTVEEYVDALKRGDIFPPIALEEETNRLLDGRHRWQASKNYLRDYKKTEEDKRIDWAVPSDTIEVEYHVVPEGIPHKLYAARLSARHGLRISASDRRELAREIYTANPEFTSKVMAEFLGVSDTTVDNYVKDLRATHEEERNAIIYILYYLGWTQEEIADKTGITQPNVFKILSKFPELGKVIKNQYESGLPADDLATRNN